jgi:hypothetical protein
MRVKKSPVDLDVEGKNRLEVVTKFVSGKAKVTVIREALNCCVIGYLT